MMTLYPKVSLVKVINHNQSLSYFGISPVERGQCEDKPEGSKNVQLCNKSQIYVIFIFLRYFDIHTRVYFL